MVALKSRAVVSSDVYFVGSDIEKYMSSYITKEELDTIICKVADAGIEMFWNSVTDQWEEKEGDIHLRGNLAIAEIDK